MNEINGADAKKYFQVQVWPKRRASGAKNSQKKMVNQMLQLTHMGPKRIRFTLFK